MTEELKEELLNSIRHQIHWLKAVEEELVAGTYTAEQAAIDSETAQFNEGFNWLSIMQDIAEA